MLHHREFLSREEYSVTCHQPITAQARRLQMAWRWRGNTSIFPKPWYPTRTMLSIRAVDWILQAEIFEETLERAIWARIQPQGNKPEHRWEVYYGIW